MSVGERVYDLGAEPVKGTAKGAWGGLKKGAVLLGVTAAALAGWGLLAVTAPVWLVLVGAGAAGGAGLAAGGAIGAPVGAAAGGVSGAFSGVKKFVMGRDPNDDPRQAQLAALRQQVAAEEAQAAAMLRQQQRAAAVDGANPNAATDNAARVAARAQEAAAGATPSAGRG